jgi:predicted aconitase with swiveling domain
MQLAQVAHVATEHALQHPKESRSTPIGIVLEVPDEETLLAYAAVVAGFPTTVFAEEDLDGQHTALAVVCDGQHFSSLPLAGRSMAGV